MQLQVKGRNFEISEQIRSYAEGKLGKLDKLVKDPTRIELELLVEKNPSISDNHIAEATVFTRGTSFVLEQGEVNRWKTFSTNVSGGAKGVPSAWRTGAAIARSGIHRLWKRRPRPRPNRRQSR